MTPANWISLAGFLVAVLGSVWKIAESLIAKNAQLQRELRSKDDESIKYALMSMTAFQQKLHDRMDRWEVTQNAQITSSMRQFHELELSMKGYSKDVLALHEEQKRQYAHFAGEMDRLWKTVVKEISPGVYRVSEPKKP